MIYNVKDYPGLTVEIDKVSFDIYITRQEAIESIPFSVVEEVILSTDLISFGTNHAFGSDGCRLDINEDTSWICKSYPDKAEIYPDGSDFKESYNRIVNRIRCLKYGEVRFVQGVKWIVSPEFICGRIRGLGFEEVKDLIRPMMNKFTGVIRYQKILGDHRFECNGYLLVIDSPSLELTIQSCRKDRLINHFNVDQNKIMETIYGLLD